MTKFARQSDGSARAMETFASLDDRSRISVRSRPFFNYDAQGDGGPLWCQAANPASGWVIPAR